MNLKLLANLFIGTFADWENIFIFRLNLLPDHGKHWRLFFICQTQFWKQRSNGIYDFYHCSWLRNTGCHFKELYNPWRLLFLSFVGCELWLNVIISSSLILSGQTCWNIVLMKLDIKMLSGLSRGKSGEGSQRMSAHWVYSFHSCRQ